MKLKTEYEGRSDTKGITYKLVESHAITINDKPAVAAIYSVSKGGFEVMVIRPYEKDVKIKNRLVARKGDAKYPSSSQWGQYGWTYLDLQDAQKRLNALVCA